MRIKMILILFAILVFQTLIFAAFDTIYEIIAKAAPFYEADSSETTTKYKASIGCEFEIRKDLGTKLQVIFTKTVGEKPELAKVSELVEKESILPVELGVLYEIQKVAFTDAYYELNRGFTAGPLTIPFKLWINDLSLGTDSTLGASVGYIHTLLFGLPSALVVGGGISLISTQDINSKSPDNKAGLTIVGGLVVPIKEGFQLGAFAGVDHLGGEAGANWIHENAIWVSFGIGYNFLQLLH